MSAKVKFIIFYFFKREKIFFFFFFFFFLQDRFEEMTKEGCGRVFVFNTTNIIHSYTLECGFH
jgi:hypothetical protein